MSEIKWYAATTFSDAEWEAYRGLEKRCISSWLPFYLDDVKRGRWKKGNARAHFPGYVFFAIPDKKMFRLVKQTSGISGIVGIDEFPSIIPTGVIDELRERLDFYRVRPYDEKAEITVEILPGSRMKVLSGPFVGLMVMIADIVGPERITVWMRAMGGEVKINLPAAALG